MRVTNADAFEFNVLVEVDTDIDTDLGEFEEAAIVPEEVIETEENNETEKQAG